ncbi:MAG TPA: PDZ domain-containing protein [Candidatus Polarisedimenticolaceae bacterium]|nr:PDZ domain-containing protein [Candidatus Polarisedimenticolaceae bacterium]
MRSVTLALLFLLPAGGAHAADPTAREICVRWRQAMHAPAPGKPGTAMLVATSKEGGIPGKVEEWVTTAGDYRAVVTREFDETEVVITAHSQLRRDWNGFLRKVEGDELARLRADTFERTVLAFGPTKAMEAAAMSASADGKQYVLKLAAPGGKPVSWTIDAATALPVAYARPGEDSVIATAYSDWRDLGGVKMPAHGKVTETNKPDYEWDRSDAKLSAGISADKFAAPKAGPSDVKMDAVVPPIPFDFDSAHIIFQASINGRPPIGWLLDTGADQQAINSTRMAGFGLKSYAATQTTGGGGTADYEFASGATFTLPGVELRNQHVAVIDETGLEKALGVPLGGLLGYDFISRFVVEIDYDKKLLTLHDPAKWTYTGSGFIVPVVFDNGIPFTNATISVPTKPAIPAYFVLDFGAQETMTLTSPYVKAHDLARLAQTNATVNRPTGLENQFFAQNNVRGRVDKLTIGKMVVADIPINMSVNTEGAYASESFSGTVGESIYRRYHVFLDYARARIIFEPTAEVGKPFPERRTFGLSVLATGDDLHTFPVTGVRPGSPADKAGFKKGDVITAVDGTPAKDFALGQFRNWLSKEGEKHRFEVARGGETITLPVTVELISLDAK